MSKFLETLLSKITENHDKIEDFFAKKFQQAPALFYNSVDLRHSGFKIAPVDTNCFSAGFNNLAQDSQELAKKTIKTFLKNNFPDAKNILLIPENHTRNLLYLENVLSFKNLIAEEVVIGSAIENLTSKTTIELGNGGSITLNPLKKINDKISTFDGFIPDLIILNNDLTDGVPEILQNLSIPIIPPLAMGWHNRIKSKHFTIYNDLAVELAQIINIDPWLISSLHRAYKNVDFKAQIGIESLATHVDELIADLRKKYQEYGITEEPYCFIKADSGTYGIAVWPVSSGAEVLEINKKERNKMNMLKGSVQNTQVVIQEGIRTIDKIDKKICEPLIYLVDGKVVGNLFRINENRDERISLNATGMNFFDFKNLTSNQMNVGLEKNDITKIYDLIARLAALAAAFECFD